MTAEPIIGIISDDEFFVPADDEAPIPEWATSFPNPGSAPPWPAPSTDATGDTADDDTGDPCADLPEWVGSFPARAPGAADHQVPAARVIAVGPTEDRASPPQVPLTSAHSEVRVSRPPSTSAGDRPRPHLTWAGGVVRTDLTSDTVVRARPERPEHGWRRVLFDLTGGRCNPGPGTRAGAQAARRRRIDTPVRGCRRVAVLSVKGGVGKTTVAALLGLTFAEIRGDRVLAIDANPDLGTLADRLTGDVDVGIQHLLDHLSDRAVLSVEDVEHFVSSTSRLQVLAGSQEPCHGSAFTRDEYEEAITALSCCYNVMVIDTGTGLSHAALAGVLATADSVVIVSEPTVDAASRASMTLDWLAGSGFGELARGALVVMNQDRSSREVDQDAIRAHFAPPRCGAVVEVPADPHLAVGGRIRRADCRPATRQAFEELAAAVADSFPELGPRRAPEVR